MNQQVVAEIERAGNRTSTQPRIERSELASARGELRRASGVSEAPAQRFDVHWATQLSEVREAQRLRYAVFTAEMGCAHRPHAGRPAGP